MGPKCEFSGERCDVLTSSCPAKHGQCFASGPGKDHFESTKIIATRLFEGAWVIQVQMNHMIMYKFLFMTTICFFLRKFLKNRMDAKFLEILIIFISLLICHHMQPHISIQKQRRPKM